MKISKIDRSSVTLERDHESFSVEVPTYCFDFTNHIAREGLTAVTTAGCRVMLGTSSCCRGHLLKYFLTRGEGSQIEAKLYDVYNPGLNVYDVLPVCNKERTPFEQDLLVIGSGCCGDGVRLVKFGGHVEDIVPSGEIKETPYLSKFKIKSDSIGIFKPIDRYVDLSERLDKVGVDVQKTIKESRDLSMWSLLDLTRLIYEGRMRLEDHEVKSLKEAKTFLKIIHKVE